jgi:hypothetical protein
MTKSVLTDCERTFMDTVDEKQLFFDELATIRAKRDRLPNGSLVRIALSGDVLQQVDRKIREKSLADLSYDFWPPIYGFFALKSDDAIAEFDRDIRLVIQHVASNKVSGVLQFMAAREGCRHGDWYGGLFDLWTKATFAKSGKPFELDRPLPNGRDSDVCIQMNGRRFHVESTVFTRDDESEVVWRRYLIDKRLDPNKVLVRPGPYCPPNAKGPSLYYLTLRLYAKIFDKLAKNLNPSKSQFADDEPNVLLVSCSSAEARPDSPSVGWALDELFADQPKMTGMFVPESHLDISLNAWVDYRASELIAQKKMTASWFCEHSNEVMAAPRRLGAILLFDGCKLRNSRINYNSTEDAQLVTRKWRNWKTCSATRRPRGFRR